jgi:hypothetical protein
VLRWEGAKVLYRVLFSECSAEVLRCQRVYLIFKFFVVFYPTFCWDDGLPYK